MGQKTFYLRISIKTLENRLIPTRNHKSHPKPKLRGIFLKKLIRKTDNLLILLVFNVATG